MSSCCKSHKSCCLKTEPTEISDKLMSDRRSLSEQEFCTIALKSNAKVELTADMIIGDIIQTFPHSKELFKDIDPLGINEFSSNNLSISMFLSGTGIDEQKFCTELNQLINQ